MITNLKDFINERNGPNLTIKEYEPNFQWFGSDITASPEPDRNIDNKKIIVKHKRKKNRNKNQKELSDLDRVEKMTDLHTSGDIVNFGNFNRKPGKAGTPSPPFW